MQEALIVDSGSYGDPTSTLNSRLRDGWTVAKMERFGFSGEHTSAKAGLVIIEKAK